MSWWQAELEFAACEHHEVDVHVGEDVAVSQPTPSALDAPTTGDLLLRGLQARTS
jgi:hypothetical protein